MRFFFKLSNLNKIGHVDFSTKLKEGLRRFCFHRVWLGRPASFSFQIRGLFNSNKSITLRMLFTVVWFIFSPKETPQSGHIHILQGRIYLSSAWPNVNVESYQKQKYTYHKKTMLTVLETYIW